MWYTLSGELDKESKNLIKEVTHHKVDNLVELSEIGMSIYSGAVASNKITGKISEESEQLNRLLNKVRKPTSIATRTKRLVKKFMPKKRYRKFKVVDIEELAKKQCLKPNIQLFANKIINFSSDDNLMLHFKKHGNQIAKILEKENYTVKNYLEDANYIIKHGEYIEPPNGYLKFMSGKKYGFVGLDRATGNITTFHIKSVQELSKKGDIFKK